MQEKTYKEGFALLLSVFPQLKIEPGVFWQFLKDIPDQTFKTAINGIINNIKDMYPNTNIIALIKEYSEGNKDDKAMIAWQQAKQAVKEVGYYQSPDFKDPIISHCIKHIGGWMEFCSVQIKELPFIEKRFMDAYRLFHKREVKKPLGLLGFHAQNNHKEGHLDDIPEPIQIGYDDDTLVIEDKQQKQIGL